jgi:hypothetical protein
MRKFKWIFVLALLGAIAGGSGVWAADAVNWSVTKLKVEDTAYIKTLYLGGDPKYGSNGTAMTATGDELNYLDITTLGTGAARKAVVLDSGEDYAWPATGILKLGVVKDVANTILTSTFAELNILDGVTASTAEINQLDNRIASFTLAPAAGGSNVCEVTITPKDAAGATIVTNSPFIVYLSDAASGLGLTGTAASGTVTAKSAEGAVLGTLEAKKSILCQGKATEGTFVLEITDTGKTGYYVCAVSPVTGGVTVSAQLETGDYGT